MQLQMTAYEYINFPSLFIAIFLPSIEQHGVQRLLLVTTLIISSLKEVKFNNF